MPDKTNQPRKKRLPKSQRISIRRLKQAARKEAGLDSALPGRATPAPAPKKQVI